MLFILLWLELGVQLFQVLRVVLQEEIVLYNTVLEELLILLMVVVVVDVEVVLPLLPLEMVALVVVHSVLLGQVL
jgi:hypothetical protein